MKKSYILFGLIAAVSFTVVGLAVGKDAANKVMSNVMLADNQVESQPNDQNFDNQNENEDENEDEMSEPQSQMDPMNEMDPKNSDFNFNNLDPNHNDNIQNEMNNKPPQDTHDQFSNNPQDPGQQWTPSEQDCKNDYRDAKRMENEINQFIKNATKKNTDTSKLSQSLEVVKQAKEKLQSCTSLTGEDLQTIRETLMGNNGVQKELDVSRCRNEYGRIKKDQERMKKDFEMSKQHLGKMGKEVSGEMSQKINEQLQRIDRMAQIQETKLNLMDETDCKLWSGGDYSDQQMESDDLNAESQDLSYEMDDFWYEFKSIQENAWASEMFNKVEQEVKNAFEKEYPKMPKELQVKFDMIASTVKELVAKGRECQKSNDSECIQKIQQRLDEVAQKGAELFRPPDVDFSKYGFDKTVNQNFQTATQDMNFGEANEVINYLLTLDPTLAAKITDPSIANKIFKIMGRIPENMKNKYLDDVGKLKEVFGQAMQVNPELANYKEEIIGYSYFGDGLNGLVVGLEDLRDGKITVSEFASELETFRSTSKKAEVNAGVTKFEDATTDTWFYDAANKEEFNLIGKKIDGKQVFDASGTTTFAEMLKVLDEAAGLKQVQGETSYAKANSHWSKGYYKAVEDKNITLMDPDRQITRGEMARLITEIFNIPASTMPTRFSDLAGNTYESQISTLYSYGIIKGDDGSDKVRPNDTINRAEAFTLAKNALDKLQYATISQDEMNAYTNDLDAIK